MRNREAARKFIRQQKKKNSGPSLQNCKGKSVLEPSNSHTYQMDDDQVWFSSIIRETVDGMKSNCHGKLANRPGQQMMMMVKKYSIANKIKEKYLMRNREAARMFIRQQKPTEEEEKLRNFASNLQREERVGAVKQSHIPNGC